MSVPHQDEAPDDNLLDADDALEEIKDAEGDAAMDSDEEHEEVTIQNDSIAYFDAHKDSVFAIAQHPTLPSLIATGGSEGEGEDAPGKGFVFDTAAVEGRPVLPASYVADPGHRPPRSTALQSLFTLDGHSDSVSALAFTLPRGEFLVSGGLDGRLRAFRLAVDARNKPSLAFLAEAQEVPEINWLAACPARDFPNTVALGASDGSVWVYMLHGAAQGSPAETPLQIVQSYFVHAAPCTAGAWSPDGTFLATVAEDGSLHVWDVWGVALARGVIDHGQTVVSLTGEDQRFEVEGGLYSVAVDPRSTLVAVGGAGGAVKVVSLPRIPNEEAAPSAQTQGGRPGKAKAKAKGAEGGSSKGGVVLASLHTQTDGIESLSFSPRQPLLAAASVDGSIAVYNTTRQFQVRRHIKAAHEEYGVVKVEFVKGLGDGWLLTSCGMDGVVRRWDARGATASGHVAPTDAAGLVREWRGHRGDGEGGGVLGFVQGITGERIATAGDDSVVLVFEA